MDFLMYKDLEQRIDALKADVRILSDIVNDLRLRVGLWDQAREAGVIRDAVRPEEDAVSAQRDPLTGPAFDDMKMRREHAV